MEELKGALYSTYSLMHTLTPEQKKCSRAKVL